ncbi:hypothetical protein MAHJHV28_45560 [Mycobacterium avium subsp. hominissuis]
MGGRITGVNTPVVRPPTLPASDSTAPAADVPYVGCDLADTDAVAGAVESLTALMPSVDAQVTMRPPVAFRYGRAARITAAGCRW